MTPKPRYRRTHPDHQPPKAPKPPKTEPGGPVVVPVVEFTITADGAMTVTVDGREVRINGEPVGIAKTHAFDRKPLEPIASGVIPPGRFYVQGLSPDSFDSRYRQSGLVRAEQVIGVVDPIF